MLGSDVGELTDGPTSDCSGEAGGRGAQMLAVVDRVAVLRGTNGSALPAGTKGAPRLRMGPLSGWKTWTVTVAPPTWLQCRSVVAVIASSSAKNSTTARPFQLGPSFWRTTRWRAP